MALNTLIKNLFVKGLRLKRLGSEWKQNWLRKDGKFTNFTVLLKTTTIYQISRANSGKEEIFLRGIFSSVYNDMYLGQFVAKVEFLDTTS